MKTEHFIRFIKDISKAVRAITLNPDILTQLADEQFEIFRSRFESYKPRTEEGQANRGVIETLIARELDLRGEQESLLTQTGLKTAELVAEKTSILELHIRQPGFVKKLDSAVFLDKNGNNGNVDADVLHVHQDLIDMEYPKTLLKHRAKFLEYVRAWEVRAAMLTPGNGQYLVPKTCADAMYAKFDEFTTTREELLDEFEAKWEGIIKDAKKTRGAFFAQSDYPPFKAVRSKYVQDMRFIPNAVDEGLRQKSKEAFQRETERLMVQCTGAAAEIQAALRAGFRELIEHFVERLSPDPETGKRSRFNEKRLTDIVEFIDMFKERNVTNDEQLASLCDQAKLVLTDVSVTDIRSKPEVAQSLKQAFDDIVVATDDLIEVRTRKVRVASAGD